MTEQMAHRRTGLSLAGHRPGHLSTPNAGQDCESGLRSVMWTPSKNGFYPWWSFAVLISPDHLSEVKEFRLSRRSVHDPVFRVLSV
jgi:hypothetical protein